MKKLFGFTLIEILITVALIVLLVGFGVPQYNAHLMQSRRQEAVQLIMQYRILINNYNLKNDFYPPAGTIAVPIGKYYTLSYVRNSNTSYRITATPRSGTSQANDTLCPSIYITEKIDNPVPTICL